MQMQQCCAKFSTGPVSKSANPKIMLQKIARFENAVQLHHCTHCGGNATLSCLICSERLRRPCSAAGTLHIDSQRNN